ncbi:TPA: hypothetical protein JG812_000280 [Vibrio parahaemolyticus]|nr:hypothetical protein [Vibrio parahaemolyticus]HAV1423311.1 hypothetical protein [Vibrio parahaemolyticus]HAV1994313.1 hypothetical protein [Vibrio parahaemolyticus]
MYKPLLLVVLSSSLAACAYNQKPVVDMTNVDQAQYEQDFAYCQGYAEKVDKTEALVLRKCLQNKGYTVYDLD